MPATDRLRVAACAFAATDDIAANAARVRAAIDAAAQAEARVLLTPECCLPGYPSAARADLAGIDWCALGDVEDELCTHALRRGLMLVLGSAGPVGGERQEGVANEAVIGGAVPPARYRKRVLTPADREHFLPGERPLAVALDGWRLGLGICFELRFHDCFLDLAADGADAFLVIAHMAGPDPDPGTKAALIPQLCAARAAEFATPLVFCNTAAADRYCDSGAWDARGVEIARQADGLVTVDVARRESFAPWYAALRATVLTRSGRTAARI